MRPLLIKMQGFGPFRDETEVDFADVELMSLVGSTGSGKSTILDAITFALFGRIARLDAKAVAPVVNALSQEARVAFDFELGDKSYTAIRVVRRTKAGASTKEVRLECAGETLASGIDEAEAAVEQLLGMNFDRFTKVVFLPQGKFAAFLHDRPGDRQTLLRLLLGLGMYEQLGRRARDIKTTATNQLEVLRPKLEEAAGSEEHIAQLEAAASELEGLHGKARTRLSERAEQVREVARLSTEADEFAILAYAMAAVTVPDAVCELGGRLEAAAKLLKACEVQAAEAKSGYATASIAVAEGPDKARCERWRHAFDDVDRLADAIDKLAELAQKAIQKHSGADDAVQVLEGQIESAAALVEKTERAEGDAAVAIAKAREVSQVEKDLAAHVASGEMRAGVEALQVQQGDAAGQSEGAAMVLATAKAAFEEASAALREIETASHVDVLVGALRVGAECPVCRQLVNDLPDHEPSGEVEIARARCADTEAQLDKARDADGAAKHKLAGLQTRIEDAERDLARHTELVDALPTTKALTVEQDARRVLEQASAEARAAADGARKAERELRESATTRSILAAATIAATNVATAQADLAGARTRHEEIAATLVDAPSRDEVSAQLLVVATLVGQQQTAHRLLTEADEAEDDARKSLDAIRREETALRLEFNERRADLAGVKPPPSALASLLADWQDFAAWAESLREPLEAHHREAAAKATELATAVAADDEQTRALCASIPEAEGVEIDDLDALCTRLVASANAAVTSARQRQDQFEKDRAEVERLGEVEEVHDLLGNLLRSNGFEQWLLDEVVESLVARASERLFELSRGQYSIEADGMTFEVRDHRNGDELRDARTLSGGETFLASLALALALADSVDEMAPNASPPIECLFLDEGFGTLDPETLDVVASAIEELGAAGRMVGVITHIRDLAERMPVRFEVTKQATTSVVEKVFS